MKTSLATPVSSVYAFMQNVSVINDHIHGCFRATDYGATARSRC
jgi:DNA-3-methyladenine glycosylase I